MSDPLDLDALAEVARKATPGDWVAYFEEDYAAVMRHDRAKSSLRVATVFNFEDGDEVDASARADATHVANFDPPTVLALIAALKEAQARIDRASDWLAENRPIRCSYASPDDHDDAETLIQILYRSEAP